MEAFAAATVFCPDCDEELTVELKIITVEHVGRVIYGEIEQDFTADHLCRPE